MNESANFLKVKPLQYRKIIRLQFVTVFVFQLVFFSGKYLCRVREKYEQFYVGDLATRIVNICLVNYSSFLLSLFRSFLVRFVISLAASI